MADKTVRFDYYRVQCKKLNEKQELYFPLLDIEPILTKAVGLSVLDRTYQYGEEEARLQTVKLRSEKFPSAISKDNKDGSHRVWELQFIRIRKDYLPGVANSTGDFDILDLDDDEFIGEEVSVLYDPTLSVMMIQRNRNSLSPSGIETYFNEVIPEDKMILKPLHLPEHLRKMTEGKYYRSLSFSLTDVPHFPDSKLSSISSIIRSTRKLNAINIELRISLGQSAKKNDTLEYKELIESINDLKNISEVKRLELKVKDSIDAKVETYDLIDQRLMEGVTLKYSRQEKITHRRIYDKMLVLYSERFKEVLKCIPNS